MIKCNPKYTWCPNAVDKGNVRVAIVVDYPKIQSDIVLPDEHFVMLKEQLERQGYMVIPDYGSDMSFRELIEDIDYKLNKTKPKPYVLFTRRSELLDNTYGRPDTMFMYYDKSNAANVNFGIVPFGDLTQRDIRESNNMMKLYWGGTFSLGLNSRSNEEENDI